MVIHTTPSCSLCCLDVNDYELQDKQKLINAILEFKEKGAKNDNYGYKEYSSNCKLLYCVVMPQELKLMDVLEQVGFKCVTKGFRNHSDGEISLYTLRMEKFDKIIKNKD
jgi:hypothetical protein